jgi:soluble lytic murein transglycosylase-like protein
MRNGPSLVIRGTFLGSIVLALLGWFLAGQINISTSTEVAYAAVPSQEAETSVAQDTCQVNLSYPLEILQWCRIITDEAIRAELPPNLIAAVMLQESGGDPSAYSASGAVGLMQVMPRDGIASEFECINGPCFASRPTIEELLEPGYNIEYGSQMLSGLVARQGSFREALKAYGPMDVDYSYADRVLSIYENYR